MGFDEADFLVRFLAADLGIGLVLRVAFMGLFLDVWGFAGFLAGLLAATIFFYFFFSDVSCSCVELIQWSTIVDCFAEGFRVLSMVLTDGR